MLNLTAMATKYVFTFDRISLHFDFIKYQCRPVLHVLVHRVMVFGRDRRTVFFFLIGGRMNVFGREGAPRASREKFCTQKGIVSVRYPD